MSSHNPISFCCCHFTGNSGSINNPVYVAKEGGEEKRKSRTLNTIVSADLRIIDGLNLGGQYAANYYFRETDKFTPTLPEYFSDGTPDPANKNMRNSVSQAHQDALTQTLQLTLNFQKQINKHEIGALLGYSLLPNTFHQTHNSHGRNKSVKPKNSSYRYS